MPQRRKKQSSAFSHRAPRKGKQTPSSLPAHLASMQSDYLAKKRPIKSFSPEMHFDLSNPVHLLLLGLIATNMTFARARADDAPSSSSNQSTHTLAKQAHADLACPNLPFLFSLFNMLEAPSQQAHTLATKSSAEGPLTTANRKTRRKLLAIPTPLPSQTETVVAGVASSVILEPDELMTDSDHHFLTIESITMDGLPLPNWAELQPLPPRLLSNYRIDGVYIPNLAVSEDGTNTFIGYTPDIICLDTEDPTNPVVRWSRPQGPDEYVYKFILQGSTLYVANWRTFLALDVSQSPPVLISSHQSTHGHIISADVDEAHGLAFLVTDQRKLIKLDITTNPSSPSETTVLSIPGCEKIKINYPYLYCFRTGLVILDALSLTTVGSYYVEGIQDIAIDEPFLYMAIYTGYPSPTGTVIILDIHDKTMPVLIWTHPPSPPHPSMIFPYSIWARGSTLIKGDQYHGVRLYDTRDKSNPIFLSTEIYSLGGLGWSIVFGIEVRNNNVFFASFDAGLGIVKMGRQKMTFTPGAINAGSHELQITIRDSYGNLGVTTVNLNVERSFSVTGLDQIVHYTEGQAQSFIFNVTSLTGSTITSTVTMTPANAGTLNVSTLNLTQDPQTGKWLGDLTVTFTPPLIGRNTPTFHAEFDDGTTLTTADVLSSITPVNHAPVVSHPIEPSSTFVGVPFFQELLPLAIVSDVDIDDSLRITAIRAGSNPAPSWISTTFFGNGSALLTINPPANVVNTTLTVEISDGHTSVTTDYPFSIVESLTVTGLESEEPIYYQEDQPGTLPSFTIQSLARENAHIGITLSNAAAMRLNTTRINDDLTSTYDETVGLWSVNVTLPFISPAIPFIPSYSNLKIVTYTIRVNDGVNHPYEKTGELIPIPNPHKVVRHPVDKIRVSAATYFSRSILFSSLFEPRNPYDKISYGVDGLSLPPGMDYQIQQGGLLYFWTPSPESAGTRYALTFTAINRSVMPPQTTENRLFFEVGPKEENPIPSPTPSTPAPVPVIEVPLVPQKPIDDTLTSEIITLTLILPKEAKGVVIQTNSDIKALPNGSYEIVAPEKIAWSIYNTIEFDRTNSDFSGVMKLEIHKQYGENVEKEFQDVYFPPEPFQPPVIKDLTPYNHAIHIGERFFFNISYEDIVTFPDDRFAQKENFLINVIPSSNPWLFFTHANGTIQFDLNAKSQTEPASASMSVRIKEGNFTTEEAIILLSVIYKEGGLGIGAYIGLGVGGFVLGVSILALTLCMNKKRNALEEKDLAKEDQKKRYIVYPSLDDTMDTDPLPSVEPESSPVGNPQAFFYRRFSLLEIINQRRLAMPAIPPAGPVPPPATLLKLLQLRRTRFNNPVK